MTIWHVAGALLSAVLHAGWNAAVKASPNPREAMAAQMAVGAILVLPGLAWTGLPSHDAWVWMCGSTAFNVVTIISLVRAYELFGFGAVYPVVRAISVLIVVPLAGLLSGELLSAFGIAGICLVCTSLLLLGLVHARGGAEPKAGFAWVVVAGIGTAAFVTCDAQGVRHSGSQLAYGFTMCIANAVSVIAAQWMIAPLPSLTKRLVPAMPIASAAIASYLLILWVWSQAPIAPSAALRDTSAVFAILIAILWLKEPFTRLKLFAILLSGAAVPLLRFA